MSELLQYKWDRDDEKGIGASMEQIEMKYEQRLEELVQETKNKKNSVISLKEIEDYFVQIPLNEEQMDQILEHLENQKIEVIGELMEDVDADEEFLEEPQLKDLEEEEVDLEAIDLSVPEEVGLEDPVRMYLKEIGKVPLLTSQPKRSFKKLNAVKKGNPPSEERNNTQWIK